MSQFGTLSRTAKAYVVGITTMGGIVLVAAIAQLMRSPLDERWFVLAILTLVTGSVTVKIPSVAATLSVSEAFVFSAAILFGWSGGTVVAALEGLVISLWLQRRKQPAYRVVFNAAAPALSIFVASLVYVGLGAPDARSVDVEITKIILPLCAFAATYFVTNTGLIAIAIAVEQQLSAIQVWKQNFMWLWLNFFSGASVAALLVSFGNKEGVGSFSALWIVLPLLGVSYFTYRSSMARIDDANKHVEKLNTLYLSTIETLAMAIDAKDQITHGHIRRVQSYAVALAREIGINDEPLLRAIAAAALLHDMGKLAVPEYILNKPGPLTPAEFERMKQHAAVGADILSSIDFPYPVVPIVRHHHENWDGGGYPSGLKGTDIPIGARVLSVVDCFDALTSDRPYRPRLSDKDALQVLRDRRGAMYDPLIVDAFLGLYHRLKQDKDGKADLPITDSILKRPESSFPRLAAISASAGESRTMYRLIQRLAAQQSYSEALDDVVQEIATLIPASVVAFYSINEQGSDLEVTHTAGAQVSWLKGRRVGFGERVIGWSASSGRSVLNADAQGEFGELARGIAAPLRSCLTIPVQVEGERLGVFAAFSDRENGFRQEDQRVLEAVIRHISPILNRLRPIAGSQQPKGLSTDSLELTPVSMLACRCASTSAVGTESVGMALSVIRRFLGSTALTQIVHGNDIFIGINVGEVDMMETLCENLRSALAASGLLRNGSGVVYATTPRDGTNLEHLLYACRKRLGSTGGFGARIH